MKVGLIKTSLVNYPGRVAAAVFLPGCNLRCPFCHNGELARASVVIGPKEGHADGEDYIELDEVYAHLEKRKGVLGGVAISGGEPFISPALPAIIQKAKSLGLAVKIDTNGTLPERMAAVLTDPSLRPDMIAMDVKTSPSRYGELATEYNEDTTAGEPILRSIALLSREAERGIRVEYRTVLVPGLVGEKELREIGAILPGNADWELAKFMPGNCLDASYDDIEPYGPAMTGRLVDVAKSVCPGARLR